MSAFYLRRQALILCGAVALLSGCSTVTMAPVPETGLTSLSLARQAAMARPQPVHLVYPDHGKSWMAPGAEKIKELLYVSDAATDDVFVYDYASGNEVGKLTGFDQPLGSASTDWVTSS